MEISRIREYPSDESGTSEGLKEFFNNSIGSADTQVASFMNSEFNRQNEQIELIASENIVSKAVLEAQGSVLTNKYAEGYPHKRYYGGCEFVDNVDGGQRHYKRDRACNVDAESHCGVEGAAGNVGPAVAARDDDEANREAA